jgi:hypothetical protein
MNIPNLPAYSPIVDEQRNRTPVEQVFMQQLITELQQNAGPEGLVVPTLSADQIFMIQNNVNPQNGQYTTAYGTIVYNSTANSIMIAINNGSGAPIFKTVTLT